MDDNYDAIRNSYLMEDNDANDNVNDDDEEIMDVRLDNGVYPF